MKATAATAVLHNNNNKEPLELFDTDESVSKRTVATAPLTPTMDFPTNTGYRSSPEVLQSSSTLSSCQVDNDHNENSHNNSSATTSSRSPNHNKDQHIEDHNDDYQIPHACSSPYLSEAFQFSSEWLNGRGELALPEMKPSAEEGGEEESQASGGYFEPVDLDSSHWTQAMNIDGATFGFAIVALATALMHPFLFVAGALTAFGTMQAVGAGYEYCSSGYTSSSDHALCCNSSSNNSAWEQCLMLLCHKDLPAEATSTSDAKTAAIEAPEDTETTTDTTDKNKEVDDSGILSNSMEVVPVTGGNKNNAMTPATALATMAQSSTVITQTQTTETTEILKSDQQKQQGDETQPNQRQIAPAAKQQITMELLHQTYPHLENRVVEDVSFPGLNAIEFFRVFFADDAPYNFKALQEKRGDLDIVYGHWDELDPVQDRHSLHHDATQTTIPIRECRYKSFLGRVVTFKAKTNNFIGPVYACTRKTQKVLLAHKTLVVMESRTDLSEIPFCDKFYVLERWIISAEKVDGKYVSNLSATSQVIFTQSCQFASQIKSKSASTIQDLVKCWCVMAKEALKLTEESKKQRLQQQEEEEDEDDSDLEDDEDLSNKESEARKENVPPTEDEEEGVEVSWPENEAPVDVGESKEAASKSTRSRSSSLRRPRILKHSDSAPFPSQKRDRPRPLQGFRRSVSHLWGKR